MADDFKANSFVPAMQGRSAGGDDLMPPMAPPQFGQRQNQNNKRGDAGEAKKTNTNVPTPTEMPRVRRNDFNANVRAEQNRQMPMSGFDNQRGGKRDVFKTTEEQKVEEEKLRKMIANEYLSSREILREIGARFDGRLTPDQITILVGEVQRREYEKLK